MQGLRALKAEFGDMLQFDKTLDGALDATMPVGNLTQELQKYENRCRAAELQKYEKGMG